MLLAAYIAGSALLVAAALHDGAFRTVPNGMSAAIAVCGVVLRLGNGDLLAGLAVASVVFAAAALCWRRGWMGGGDVKLLAAAALLVLPAQVPMMLAFVAIAGGMLALPYLVARRWRATRPAVHPPAFHLPAGRPAAIVARIVRAERWRLRRGGPLPYAVAIAAGTGATLMRMAA